MARIGSLHWIHVFIDVPPHRAEAARTFWSRALCWSPAPAWEDRPEFTTLLPPQGDSYVHVQEVDDTARVHLDVVVDDLDQARDAAAELGARADLRTPRWQAMRSPGGLPFCLTLQPAAGVRPGGTHLEQGHHSRLAQVCIDVPDERFDAELAFWTALTGWSPGAPGRPEYSELVGPSEAPLRLLVQRLGRDDEGRVTRAHIDLGTDDIDAEVDRLAGEGAREVAPWPGWVVMEDPVGLPFCVTSKPPT